MPTATPASVLYSRLLARARLRHLQLLVAIADSGNLRRSAEQVGMSQPAATQALAELEQLLDTALFERHARGMRLTATGHLLIPAVRQMLLALRASAESLSAWQMGQAVLRVGFIPAAASAYARVVLENFARLHPGIRLDLQEDRGEHLLQALSSGGLDMVVSRRPPQLPQGMEFWPLQTDEAVVLAALDHPLAGRTGLTRADLQALEWMVPPAGTQVREKFELHMARAGVTPRLHPVSTTSASFLIEILRDGQTVAMVPRSLGRALCDWGLVSTLELEALPSMDGLGALATPEALKLAPVQLLLEVLKKTQAA